MKRTGIVKDNRYLEHEMDPGHPESPERLKAIYKMLEETEMKRWVEVITPRAALRDELEMVHTPSYIDLVASTTGKPYYRLDMDTSTCAKSYEAALWAAGGFLKLIQAVLEGKLDNGFALVRPPGHHAERDRAMGFCLFNNVALGACYAIRRFSLQRVLIVDWDVHHGNGTQNSFYQESKVLYFSVHRYGFFYPGTGAATEVGKGKGEGYNVNVPLSTGAGDAEYGNIFEKILKPIALEYEPQLVLVSAGFDTHHNDPLGGMEVTEKGYVRMTQILMGIAEAVCQGKLVMTLEGGYDVSAQSRAIKAVLKEMAQASPFDSEDLLEKENANDPRIERFILQLKDLQRPYWKNL
ncbi:MAG: histone deacetylase [Deltaproteobacteria bacterium RBG_13_47_9]|nr:MAG: histone deacetylase [Deltaproteobacteria bacterium RBG_13_47_9]